MEDYYRGYPSKEAKKLHEEMEEYKKQKKKNFLAGKWVTFAHTKKDTIKQEMFEKYGLSDQEYDVEINMEGCGNIRLVKK